MDNRKKQTQIHGDTAQLKWKIPPVILLSIDNVI